MTSLMFEITFKITSFSMFEIPILKSAVLSLNKDYGFLLVTPFQNESCVFVTQDS